jgi:beta-alanine--pyruvate transaminase
VATSFTTIRSGFFREGSFSFKVHRQLPGNFAVAFGWEDAIHSLKGGRHVIDLRNLGLIAGIELESIPGKVGKRAFEAFVKAYEDGLLIRVTGDIIALSPPLIVEKTHIDEMFDKLGKVLKTVD